MRSPEAVWTATARDPTVSTDVTSVSYRNVTPCFSAAAAMAVGSACMPPFGKNTPATESMYAMTA